MKERITELLEQAISALKEQGFLPADLKASIQVEQTRDKSHGDFASNLAMTLAKAARSKPRDIAERIVAALPASKLIDKTEIAGPGFINFFVSADSSEAIVQQILDAGRRFGRNDTGAGRKVQVEFVSANPTGPLHVGHGRGAAYGASLANILKACGFSVETEYYVNDAGRQMDILGTSVWLRYLQACGEGIPFPSNGYQGDYISTFADELKQLHGERFRRAAGEVCRGVCADAPDGGDKEKHIDDLISRAKTLLGEQDYQTVFELGLEHILGDIREDLHEFGVSFDSWFSERSLSSDSSQIDAAICTLQQNGYIEERDGALWFLSTRFGDDKDRVVKRENGQTTYFASDIAYHKNKFERGYEQVINIWGADHHGYIARVKAALSAMNIDPDRLIVRLVQLVSLYRGGEQVQMSTRSGSFVTLRDLREEVGNDAARFFYVTRKVEQPTDFDLDLAKSQSRDNPVYYIQYAHARVASVMRKLEEQGLQFDLEQGLANLAALTEQHERDLLTRLRAYPDVVSQAGANYEPHALINYLRELAGDFHTYYNAVKVLIEDEQLRNARLALSLAIKQVVANGLDLIGVSQPEVM